MTGQAKFGKQDGLLFNHSLWQEYKFGIGGRKAAKDFTAME